MRVSSVPFRPATASDARKAGPMRWSQIPARMTPASASAVMRSSDESPEPSTIRTPGTGIPAGHLGDDDLRAGSARPDAAVERAELLEHHLGGEVVAVRFIDRTISVSGADWSTARVTAPDGAEPSSGRPRDVDAPLEERGAKRAGGEQRRRARAGQPRARSTTSADSGGVSMPTNHASTPAHRGGCRTGTRRRGSSP